MKEKSKARKSTSHRVCDPNLYGTKRNHTPGVSVCSGFTLVEMILYVAILAIFLTGAILFMWDVTYGRVKSYTHQEVNQNVRLAGKRIMYEIRNAQDLNLPVNPTSISLQMTDSSRNPTVIDLSGGRLRIGYGSGGSCPSTSPCPITSNQVSVTSLNFTNLSSGTASLNIGFAITIESVAQRKEFQKNETFQATAELRSN